MLVYLLSSIPLTMHLCRSARRFFPTVSFSSVKRSYRGYTNCLSVTMKRRVSERETGLAPVLFNVHSVMRLAYEMDSIG